MGVLGFVPFLQKTFPQTIKTLPNRLKELGGRTLVFDGTLITQRLHFSPLPHRYRHVLGWYRLVQELRECNVQAICIFDGKERTSAKKRETERRREARKVTAARGTIEYDRLSRLRKLTTILHAREALGQPEKEQAMQSFRDIVTRTGDISSQTDREKATHAVVVPSDDHFKENPWGGMYEADIQEALSQFSEPTTSSLESFNGLTLEDISVEVRPQAEELESEPHPLPLEEIDLEPESADVDEISGALASLYLEYRASIPQLASLPTTSSVESEEDAKAVYAMSKLQHKLTVEEGHVWDQIEQLVTTGDSPTTPVSTLHVLEEKSASMSQSYDRRNNPPTAETYAECKLLLDAMGVPCIEAEGPYEAEAVASSIVVNGYGDYVVSEDTDVLVYEAPLLRNITSRKDPLTIISGSEVRTVLSLDRSNYLDFVLLLGTDFSQRIKNVGPQRALKFIREHGSIERIVEQETKYPPRLPPSCYLEQIDAARHVFETLPPLPDLQMLEQREMDDNQVANLLQRFGLHKLLADDSDYNLMGSNYFSDNP